MYHHRTSGLDPNQPLCLELILWPRMPASPKALQSLCCDNPGTWIGITRSVLHIHSTETRQTLRWILYLPNRLARDGLFPLSSLLDGSWPLLPASNLHCHQASDYPGLVTPTVTFFFHSFIPVSHHLFLSVSPFAALGCLFSSWRENIFPFLVLSKTYSLLDLYKEPRCLHYHHYYIGRLLAL